MRSRLIRRPPLLHQAALSVYSMSAVAPLLQVPVFLTRSLLQLRYPVSLRRPGLMVLVISVALGSLRRSSKPAPCRHR